MAAMSGHCRTARLLLQHGAEPDARDIRGCTPAHLALVSQQRDTAALCARHTARKLRIKRARITIAEVAIGLAPLDLPVLVVLEIYAALESEKYRPKLSECSVLCARFCCSNHIDLCSGSVGHCVCGKTFSCQTKESQRKYR